MRTAPASLRLQIGLFGRRNVGKSSLLNALVGQECSIVSDQAGTTTDPVSRPMELHAVGPVVFIDTAGVDDAGALGRARVRRTEAIFDRIDLGIIVCEPDSWADFEHALVEQFVTRGLPILVAINKVDLRLPSPSMVAALTERGLRWFATSVTSGIGIAELRRAIGRAAPDAWCHGSPMLADLIGPGDLVVLVVPIDREAPRGRLILPQVQALREVLDSRASALVLQDTQLADELARLSRPPRLVITDSQAFDRVASVTPPGIGLTSFSVLLARAKGDLNLLVAGAKRMATLGPGARVLVAEACSHHAIKDDIGRVQIPRALQRQIGGRLRFEHVQGHDFPDVLDGIDLVIHCGGCMLGRREVLSRLSRCRQAGVAVTNYGLALASLAGILDRALEPLR